MGEIISKAHACLQTYGFAANVAARIFQASLTVALHAHILDVIHVSEKTFKNELAVVVGSTRKGLNCKIRGSS